MHACMHAYMNKAWSTAGRKDWLRPISGCDACDAALTSPEATSSSNIHKNSLIHIPGQGA
eukprot:1152646-Pelagomonas_calceolata.AAC.4